MKKIIVNKEPIFFHNEDFQTIQIKVTFPFKRNDLELAYVHLLPGLLHNVCEKYNTERDFILEEEKLYILSSVCSYSFLGDYCHFTFNFMVPDVPSLQKDMLEEQFAFFSEMIYHPKLDGKAFCLDEFTREVENLKVSMEKTFKDPVSYAFIRAREAIEPDGLFASSIYNHQYLIEQATREDIYQFYQKTIYNNQPFIHVFGNVDEKRILDLCKKYFYRKPFKSKSYAVTLDHYLPLRNQPLIVTEDSSFQDTIMLNFYNIKKAKEEDKILFDTIKNLLSSQSSRLLNKKLRDENDLVYSSFTLSYDRYGLFAVGTSIHYQNLEKVQTAIQELFSQLLDEDFVAPYLDILKDRFRIGLIRRLDDKFALFQDHIIDELGIEYTMDEYYQKLCEITPHDISSFVQRMVLNTSYCVKEGKHE